VAVFAIGMQLEIATEVAQSPLVEEDVESDYEYESEDDQSPKA
jgi:hypothetical protein